MELPELENIELYLPHKLQLINIHDNRIRTMDYFDLGNKSALGSEWKPILRSMYDINKNMPEHEHYSLELILWKMAENYKGYKGGHMQNRLNNFLKNLDYSVLPFWVVEKMLSYHFNVFSYASDRYLNMSNLKLETQAK